MKKILLLLLAFFGLTIGLLYLLDKEYLLTAVRVVYFRGNSTVGIYDYEAHATRPIKAGSPQPWEQHERYNQEPLSAEIMELHENQKTTSFLVVKDGKLLSEDYFNGGSKTEQTGLWSVTKTYVSFALLKAVEDGLIDDINDPVSKYLPEWKVEQSPPLTLRHLASMSAGLSWNEMEKGPLALIAKYNFHDNLDELSVEALRAIGKPGDVQHYNSGGTQLLGTVLGKVLAPKNLSDYLSEKFWQPLGCEQDALFILDSEKQGNEKAFGGMVASARDIAKLGQVLLDNGKWKGQTILQPEDVKLMKTVPYNNKTYSYGLWTGVYEGERFYFQAGYQGQQVITVPSHNMVVVRQGHIAALKEDIEDLPFEVFEYIKEGVRIGKVLGLSTTD